jgi:hypothetical protein
MKSRLKTLLFGKPGPRLFRTKSLRKLCHDRELQYGTQRYRMFIRELRPILHNLWFFDDSAEGLSEI